ncbi:hypothetical protein TRFO_20689 [Tritrichomonas foetus]|uniref:Uncharacterized protein n=1 Tax=Tritrichomonas foetus TaxID=1144522 RepID=A0A1J4KL92_9EUKA|nr:hypothetical protein TRFO_20689 [Tritrichomonas foetus]|eukprot:OHT10141.1 hypothetical protein TRFO_20689 [Tritrichomonas foetus]
MEYEKYLHEIESLNQKIETSYVFEPELLKNDCTKYILQNIKNYCYKSYLYSLFEYQSRITPTDCLNLPFLDITNECDESFRETLKNIPNLIQEFIRDKSKAQTNFLYFQCINNEYIDYFWNVTFPNIFGGFLSIDDCENAQQFLNLLFDLDIQDREKFDKSDFNSQIPLAVFSFIKHNFLFCQNFNQLFYSKLIQSQEPLLSNKEIQTNLLIEALIDSLVYLQKPQYEIFQRFMKHDFEVEFNFPMKCVIDYLLIPLIKNWQFSPFFCANDILFNLLDESCSLIDQLVEIKTKLEIKQFFHSLIQTFENGNNWDSTSIDIKKVTFNSTSTYVLSQLDIILLFYIFQSPISENCMMINQYVPKIEQKIPNLDITKTHKKFRFYFISNFIKIENEQPTNPDDGNLYQQAKWNELQFYQKITRRKITDFLDKDPEKFSDDQLYLISKVEQNMNEKIEFEANYQHNMKYFDLIKKQIESLDAILLQIGALLSKIWIIPNEHDIIANRVKIIKDYFVQIIQQLLMKIMKILHQNSIVSPVNESSLKKAQLKRLWETEIFKTIESNENKIFIPKSGKIELLNFLSKHMNKLYILAFQGIFYEYLENIYNSFNYIFVGIHYNLKYQKAQKNYKSINNLIMAQHEIEPIPEVFAKLKLLKNFGFIPFFSYLFICMTSKGCTDLLTIGPLLNVLPTVSQLVENICGDENHCLKSLMEMSDIDRSIDRTELIYQMILYSIQCSISNDDLSAIKNGMSHFLNIIDQLHVTMYKTQGESEHPMFNQLYDHVNHFINLINPK